MIQKYCIILIIVCTIIKVDVIEKYILFQMDHVYTKNQFLKAKLKLTFSALWKKIPIFIKRFLLK